MNQDTKLTIHGAPLNSSVAIRGVIADMRKTLEAPDMVLDMTNWSNMRKGKCYTCAGGSAVIWGLGGSRDYEEWTGEEYRIASFFNAVRLSCFYALSLRGYEFPEEARIAASDSMRSAANHDFFTAWERFAEAMERAEARGWKP